MSLTEEKTVAIVQNLLCFLTTCLPLRKKVKNKRKNFLETFLDHYGGSSRGSGEEKKMASSSFTRVDDIIYLSPSPAEATSTGNLSNAPSPFRSLHLLVGGGKSERERGRETEEKEVELSIILRATTGSIFSLPSIYF
ncbi:hypothetical protein AVEN_21743-1 [Araneus ventricosus]|uniref:Uncharacterized protein n=1 Tax=Araneus ventricosus TaxID=182803 RepID=A0A4Y2EYA9_ARAVE|nr:hypothetical protein AVEN_21743-1 [Araneus ventricosus]